jgi:hypothetical protein
MLANPAQEMAATVTKYALFSRDESCQPPGDSKLQMILRNVGRKTGSHFS